LWVFEQCQPMVLSALMSFYNELIESQRVLISDIKKKIRRATESIPTRDDVIRTVLMKFPALVMERQNLTEYVWWYLYIQVLNSENEKKKELHKYIEALLPWINPELWVEYEKNKEGRKNVDFEQQMKSMLNGTWDPEADASIVPEYDEIRTSEEASTNGPIGSHLKDVFKSYDPSSTANPNQPSAPQGPTSSIKDSLGMPGGTGTRIKMSLKDALKFAGLDGQLPEDQQFKPKPSSQTDDSNSKE
ncbi:MAG: hypothetical protein V1850_02405, partial [Candidatus Bathyarchaeota archaeon]